MIFRRLTHSACSRHRRLSTSIAHVPVFPPLEFKKDHPSSDPSLSPEIWGSLQPPPPSALSAFAHRIGFGATVDNSLIQQACTHSSFLPFYQQYYPSQPPPPCNTHFATLGNALLGLFAAEYVHATYPHLPTRVLKAAVSSYVGPTTCAGIAHDMGATHLLRWHRTANTPTKSSTMHADALASIPRALVALIYHHRSLLSARKFTESFFLSREVDLRNMIKFRDPKRALLETVAKFQRERPKSRLLKETGRFSNSPVFVVGIYSGADQLGEGFGSSLKMAEFRAAEDALHRLYLTRTPPDLLTLPTSSFPQTQGDIYQHIHTKTSSGAEMEEISEETYVPGELGEAEVLFGSAGRSGIIRPRSGQGQPSSDAKTQKQPA